MLFVTVGTHEQQFNRLIAAVDDLKGAGRIEQDVFVQTGYSNYLPQHCQHRDFVDYDDMTELMQRATIVITHGGPSSFMLALYYRKPVIVVPRQKCYGEHVNDHQLVFVDKIRRRYPISVVEDVAKLADAIDGLSTSGQNSAIAFYNASFCEQFAKVVLGEDT